MKSLLASKALSAIGPACWWWQAWPVDASARGCTVTNRRRGPTAVAGFPLGRARFPLECAPGLFRGAGEWFADEFQGVARQLARAGRRAAHRQGLRRATAGG